MAPISFARGIPAPECLPVSELADCARAAIERDGSSVLSYGPGGGYGPLREWIAARHGVEPSRVVVTSGSLQGFVFLAEQLVRPGARVLVEAPTYDRPLKILRRLGADVVGLPMDDEGLQIAELARAHELLVLEDDPYGLVRYEGPALPTIFELEGGRNVAYASSFSKTVAPGVRVGYFVLPPDLAVQIEALAVSTYISPPFMTQATVHEFLRRGNFDPNLERVRGLLRGRRDAMLESLEQHMPESTSWSRPEGGYFIWVDLPHEAGDLLARAEQAGVTFVPGTDFFADGGGTRSFRLAFSFVSQQEIADGVLRLAGLLRGAAAPASAL